MKKMMLLLLLGMTVPAYAYENQLEPGEVIPILSYSTCLKNETEIHDYTTSLEQPRPIQLNKLKSATPCTEEIRGAFDGCVLTRKKAGEAETATQYCMGFLEGIATGVLDTSQNGKTKSERGY